MWRKKQKRRKNKITFCRRGKMNDSTDILLAAGIFAGICILILSLIHNVSKNRQIAQEQLNLLKQQKLTESIPTKNSICPCCETVVPTDTMIKLKSGQLVCQECKNKM
jgi:hypothetical protein